MRSELGSRQRAPFLLPSRARVHEWPNVFLQGLELLVTVLLARNRQPSPTVAAGAPHANLAAELISLPSGLLAMVCDATVQLTVRLGAAGARASRGGRTVCGVLEVLLVVPYWMLFRFPMWSELARIRSVRALCVVVHDYAHCGPGRVPESALLPFSRGFFARLRNLNKWRRPPGRPSRHGPGPGAALSISKLPPFLGRCVRGPAERARP